MLIVEDKFQALMVDDGETFRNWNRLLWGPRSRGNYWDTRRRCEASTFPPAILLLWGGRGWEGNRTVVPDIVRWSICLEILKVIKTPHLYVTFLLPDLKLSQCIDICWLLYPLNNLKISSVSWSVSSGVQPAQSFTPYFHQHYRRQPVGWSWLEVAGDWPGNIPTTNTVFLHFSCHHPQLPPPQHIQYLSSPLAKFGFKQRQTSQASSYNACLSFVLGNIQFYNWYNYCYYKLFLCCNKPTPRPLQIDWPSFWESALFIMSDWWWCGVVWCGVVWCGVVVSVANAGIGVNQIVSQILWKGNLLLSITLTQLWRPNVGFLQSHPNPCPTQSDKYWNIQSWLPEARDNCSYSESIIFQFYQMTQVVWVNQ